MNNDLDMQTFDIMLGGIGDRTVQTLGNSKNKRKS